MLRLHHSPVPEAIDRLFDARPMGSVAWGLERIEALLARLGDPQRAAKVAHVAGTNGKGSTATSIARILMAHGHRTALYTSPHLDDIRERFVVDGSPVPDEVIDGVARRLLDLPETAPTTYFEAATALAFAAFREMETEWAVIETGLGGRLDATNVVSPRVTVVTTIGLDHADVLGNTVEAIAAEKAGIFKPGVPAVIGDVGRPARRILTDAARRIGAPLEAFGEAASVRGVSPSLNGTAFRYESRVWPDGLDLATPLVGAHQAANAGLAILALEAAGVALRPDGVVAGVAGSVVPGRFEVRRREGAVWVLDIAHNREGLDVVLRTLDEVGAARPRIAVVGILADKPWSGMLGMLRLDMDAIILSQAASAPEPRRWDPAGALATIESGAPPIRVELELERALEVAAGEGAGGTILVTGSTYTVADARRFLTGA
ncbi:MAG: Mur ligase family protein [Gemmatimonadota bacterium]|nr:Mur ligase family protein [Gemmatimonadota bacterium]